MEISTLYHTEYPISLKNKPENVSWIQQQEIREDDTGGIVFAELLLNPWLTSVGPPRNFSNAGPLLCFQDCQRRHLLRHPGRRGSTKRFVFYLIRIKIVAKNPCNSCCFKLTFDHRWPPSGGLTRSLPSASLAPQILTGKLCKCVFY